MKLSVEERFWIKVSIGGPDECWDYQGSLDRCGYGKFFRDRQDWQAHRFAWTISNGDIPEGAIIRHKCDNPACCNPTHLLIGTTQDNVADRVRRDRTCRGDKHPMSKLTASIVRESRKRFTDGEISINRLAKQYGVPFSTMHRAITGVSWGWIKEGIATGYLIRHGEDSHKAKLAEDDVSVIKHRYAEGNITNRELAQQFGVSQSTISRIITGKKWEWVI